MDGLFDGRNKTWMGMKQEYDSQHGVEGGCMYKYLTPVTTWHTKRSFKIFFYQLKTSGSCSRASSFTQRFHFTIFEPILRA